MFTGKGIFELLSFFRGSVGFSLVAVLMERASFCKLRRAGDGRALFGSE